MILRLLGIVFFVIIGFMVWNLIKLIFQLGKVSGEINRKFEDMQQNRTRDRNKRGTVIEIKKDDYKVE